MKKYIVLTILAVFLIFPSEVKANILINEFSSGSSHDDWVELYNTATESADLSGYILSDSGPNSKNLSGSIPSYGFFVIDFNNYLNTPIDSVQLYNGTNLVDSIPYGGTNQVCSPDETQSVGRYPDGNNTIERFATPTKGSSNNSVTLAPCPTPTPEPTQSPTPTQSSSPAPSPTPTKTPTPLPKTPTPTPMGIRDNSATPQADVLGIRNSLISTDTPSPSASAGNSASFPIIAGAFIIGGVGLTGFAVSMAIKKQKEFSSGTISK